MKTLGNLLLTVSLIAGMISAATSYFAFVEGGEELVAGDGEALFLKASAGAIPKTAADLAALRARYEAGELTAEAYTQARKAVEPVLAADLDPGGTRLTPERLELLRSAEVGNVFTKGFAFGRWRHGWIFLLSAGGLLAGSLLVRAGAKAEVAAAAVGTGAKTSDSPEGILLAIGGVLASLRDDLPGLADEERRLHTILERLDRVQKELVPAFVDARPVLVARLGLGGYAELMDSFAAAERQMNRAWSAAADGVYAESEECLERARGILEVARGKV